jgi:hypothetical protein
MSDSAPIRVLAVDDYPPVREASPVATTRKSHKLDPIGAVASYP